MTSAFENQPSHSNPDQHFTQKGLELVQDYLVPHGEVQNRLSALDDNALQAQIEHMVTYHDPLNWPIIDETATEDDRPSLRDLAEPEIYHDLIEDEILALNPLVSRLGVMVSASRNEKNTKLMRVARNTIAAQVFKSAYTAEDPVWQSIADKLETTKS